MIVGFMVGIVAGLLIPYIVPFVHEKLTKALGTNK